jgi:MYXO-CTERM domain-containing protein
MAWLTANGRTVDEAALIQPAYCEAPADCTCSEIQGRSFVVGTVANGASGDLVLVVSDVYGNTGYEVGDEIELPSWNDIGVGDQIIADLGSFGTTLGAPRKIVDGEVAMRTCGLQAGPPGPLPLDVFADAALSADQGACKDTLGAHDPAWNQATGQGCNPSDPGSEGGEETVVTNDGCSFHPAVPGASTGGLWLLGAAGLVLLRRRRS